MSGRVLRTELRRSTAPVAGALIATAGVAGLYVLLLNGQSSLWDPQWTMLAGFQRIMLILLWPLALGAGAWQARRDRRVRMEELLLTVARSPWRRSLPAVAAMGLFVLLGYVVIFAAGAVRVASGTGYAHAGWVPIFAVGALSLVSAGWIGMGVGRLVPSVYTPPLLVVAGFLVLLAPVQLAKAAEPGVLALLLPGLSTDLDEFTTVAGPVHLAQAVWFAGLAVGGLVLVGVARRRAAFAAAPAALALAAAPAALALAVALPLLGSAPASGLQPDPLASAEVCTADGGPLVCVTRAHQDGLAALVGPARQALTLLAKLPDAPTSVHEVTPYRPGPQPADQVWLESYHYIVGSGWFDKGPDELLGTILQGAGTRQCDIGVELRVRAVVAGWLYGRFPVPRSIGPRGEELAVRTAMWETLRALPPEEQVRRVAAVRRVELTCQGDVAAALTGGGS
jgi:hypothetical protein